MNKDRMRAINGATRPVNSLHRDSNSRNETTALSLGRRKTLSTLASSPFFLSTTKLSHDDPAAPESTIGDASDVRSVLSVDRASTIASGVAEYRQTNEKNAVRNSRTRRKNATASANGGHGPDPLSRGHTPASSEYPPAPTSPDVLISPDPPPADIRSDVLVPSRKKRRLLNDPNPKETFVKKTRYSHDHRKIEEFGSEDELSVESPLGAHHNARRITNFSGLSYSRGRQGLPRGHISSTSFRKSGKGLDTALRLEVRRAVSGKFIYDRYDGRGHEMSLVLKGDTAEVHLEKNPGTIRHFRWATIVKAKIQSVEHVTSHSPILVIKRSSTDEAPSPLYIELETPEEAMELVGWIPSTAHFIPSDKEKLATTMGNKCKEIESFSNSRTNGSIATHSSPVYRSDATFSSRDPFKGELRTPRQPKIKDMMRGIESAEMQASPDVSIPMSLRSQNSETRRTQLSSPLFNRLARSPDQSPDRWTAENSDWDKKWHSSLVFPATGKNRARVDKDDIPRLDEGEFLNDNLISFYFRYLQNKLEKDRPELLEKVYIFSTFFFEKLRSSRGKINYDGVKAWTAKVDLFSYDYIVVPVNEHAHWYLAIICNAPRTLPEPQEHKPPKGPEMIDMTGDSNTSPKVSPVASSLAVVSLDDKTDEARAEGSTSSPTPTTTITTEVVQAKPKTRKSIGTAAQKFDPTEPKIITLDSLGSAHSPTCRSLKDYLIEEARHKKDAELAIKPQGMTAKNIPEQDNYCDCGVFILGYMEEFLKDPDEAARRLLQKQDTQWNIRPTQIRSQVRDLLFKLQQEQQVRIEQDKQAKKRQRKAAKKAPAEASSPSYNCSDPLAMLPPDNQAGGDDKMQNIPEKSNSKSPKPSSELIQEEKDDKPLSSLKEPQAATVEDSAETKMLHRSDEGSNSEEQVSTEAFYSAPSSPRRPEQELAQGSEDQQATNDAKKSEDLNTSTIPVNGVKRRGSHQDSPRPPKSTMLSLLGESPIRKSIEDDGSTRGATYDGLERTIDLTSSNAVFANKTARASNETA